MVNGGRSETSRGGGNGRVVRSMTNIANRIGDRKNRKVLKSLRVGVFFPVVVLLCGDVSTYLYTLYTWMSIYT